MPAYHGLKVFTTANANPTVGKFDVNQVPKIQNNRMDMMFPYWYNRIIWSSNALACVPVRNSQLLAPSARGVRFRIKTGKPGKISLVCPVHVPTADYGNNSIQKPKRLFLTYQDGDGKNGNSLVVSASLKKVRKFDGRVDTIRFVSSNDASAPTPGSSSNGWATHKSVNNGQFNFNFSRYYYYVEINMYSNGKSNNKNGLAAMGVYLTQKTPRFGFTPKKPEFSKININTELWKEPRQPRPPIEPIPPRPGPEFSKGRF